MKYIAFLVSGLCLLGSCTKTEITTITYKGFKINSLTVNKIPFVDMHGKYFDEDSLVDLSIEPYDNSRKTYYQPNVSPGSLPLVFNSALTDSTDFYSANVSVPMYVYDLDEDSVNATFLGRVRFLAKDYVGKDHFIVTNGNIELELSVTWYKQ